MLKSYAVIILLTISRFLFSLPCHSFSKRSLSFVVTRSLSLCLFLCLSFVWWQCEVKLEIMCDWLTQQVNKAELCFEQWQRSSEGNLSHANPILH